MFTAGTKIEYKWGRRGKWYHIPRRNKIQGAVSHCCSSIEKFFGTPPYCHLLHFLWSAPLWDLGSCDALSGCLMWWSVYSMNALSNWAFIHCSTPLLMVGHELWFSWQLLRTLGWFWGVLLDQCWLWYRECSSDSSASASLCSASLWNDESEFSTAVSVNW